MSDKKISARLVALLKYAKQRHEWNGWRSVAEALGDLYHPEMTLRVAVHHAVEAYKEVLDEPQFEIGNPSVHWEELLLAPILGSSSVELMGPSSMEASYTVEQFYNSMILKIFGVLTITRIDWCRDQLGLTMQV